MQSYADGSQTIYGPLLIIDESPWYEGVSHDYANFIQGLLSKYYDNFLTPWRISSLVAERLVPALQAEAPQLIVVPLMAAACITEPLLDLLESSQNMMIAMLPISAHPHVAFCRDIPDMRSEMGRRYQEYVTRFEIRLRETLQNRLQRLGTLSCIIIDITHSKGHTGLAVARLIKALLPEMKYRFASMAVINETDENSLLHAPGGMLKVNVPIAWGLHLCGTSSRLSTHLYHFLGRMSKCLDEDSQQVAAGFWATVPALRQLYVSHERSKLTSRERLDITETSAEIVHLFRAWASWHLKPFSPDQRAEQYFCVYQ